MLLLMDITTVDYEKELEECTYIHTNNLYILCPTCEISDNLGGRAHSSHSVRN